MSLAIFITYLGLLITAFSATQEYNRLKLKLSSKWWKFIFTVTLLLMFISTFDWLKIELTQRAYIQIILHDFIWQSKYQIVLALNVFSLYKTYTSTKLRTNNSKLFYELLYELQIEKKDYLFNKLIKDNLEYVFKYQEYQSLIEKARRRLYLFVDPHANWDRRIKDALDKQTIEQHEYYKKNKKFKKQEQIDTAYTKVENARKYVSHYIKIEDRNNYFYEIFKIVVLDKDNIKRYAKNDEKLGLDILSKIAQYNCFTSGYDYVNVFLLEVLLNKNSLTFNSLYNLDNSIRFIYDNQSYENGFDLGLITCNTIEKLINKKYEVLNKNYNQNSDNQVYQHIKRLFYILEQLDGNRTHLMAEPIYIQRKLLDHIHISKRDENIAYNLLLMQCQTVEYLALKTNEDYNIKLLESLLSELFAFSSIHRSKLLDIGLVYLDYIFIRNFRNAERTIEQRIEDFKRYISSDNNLKIIDLFLQVFDKTRGYNGKDYISYVKQDEILDKHWNEINKFLNDIKIKHEV